MSLPNQIIHRMEGGFLLFEGHTACAGLWQIAVDHHDRHRQAVQQVHQRGLGHKTGIQDDGVAAAIGQQLHRLQLVFRRVVAIGDNQMLAAGLDQLGGFSQQAAEVGTIEVGNHQPDTVGAFICQRLGQEIGAVAQLVHGLEHRVAGALFHLAGAIQHA
ncbi:hypothetical protein D3C80_1188660 [compost metagenome]